MNNLIKLKAKTNHVIKAGQVVEGQIMLEQGAGGRRMYFCFYYNDSEWMMLPLSDFEPA